jgi:hypothetical protein
MTSIVRHVRVSEHFSEPIYWSNMGFSVYWCSC